MKERVCFPSPMFSNTTSHPRLSTRLSMTAANEGGSTAAAAAAAQAQEPAELSPETEYYLTIKTHTKIDQVRGIYLSLFQQHLLALVSSIH